MIVTLFEKDEFPVKYDTEKKEIISCIGMCMQCPLFCKYSEHGENINCEEIIETKEI